MAVAPHSGRPSLPLPPPAVSGLELDEHHRLLPHVQALLRQELPYSIPLCRRLEFHGRRLRRGQSTGNARVWVGGVFERWRGGGGGDGDGTDGGDEDGDGERVREWLDAAGSEGRDGGKRPVAWLAAYVDLTHPGQTQVWVFASWEPAMGFGGGGAVTDGDEGERRQQQRHPTWNGNGGTNHPDKPGNASVPDLPIRAALVNALVSYIRVSHVSTLPRDPPESWSVLQRTGKIVSLPYRRSKVLFGTVHEAALIDLIESEPQGQVARKDWAYLKHIFRRPRTPVVKDGDGRSEEKKRVVLKNKEGEGEEFEFRPLQRGHLQTVMDRTVIPRTMQTLASLGSVGLFRVADQEGEVRIERPEEMPIAWGFLGTDSSVSSLHTEDEYRGQGVAVLVAEELLTRIGDAFEGLEYEGMTDVWAHADVNEKNIGSLRVMQKLGGQVWWSVAWIEVDIGEVE